VHSTEEPNQKHSLQHEKESQCDGNETGCIEVDFTARMCSNLSGALKGNFMHGVQLASSSDSEFQIRDQGNFCMDK
jgi:hypothetical protein